MRSYFWLVLITLLALVLRVVGLSHNPPGFTPDEAAFGYNAFSLLQTGRDEWGTPFYKLPYSNLESFGDYKLPLYAFLAVPAVKIFGLNEFAVRLPNAIFGTLAVLVIYTLANLTLPAPLSLIKERGGGEVKRRIGIVAALLLAISPWGIQLSRGAFEANLVTFLLPLFITLFISQKYFLAGTILALNFYSYHSARFIALILLIFYCLKIKNLPVRQVGLKLKIFTLFLFIPGLFALFGSGGTRNADVSIFSPTDSWKAVSDRRFESVQSGFPDSAARIFSNKAVFVFSQFSRNFLSYFSPEFLFTQGPKESTYGMIPGVGVMYLFEFAALAMALIYLVKHPDRYLLRNLSLIFLAVIPAALSKGPGAAANRAVPLLPFLILLSALGCVVITRFLPKILCWVVLSLSFLFFLEAYTLHNRELYSGMLYGRREALTRVANISADYDRIFVSRSLSEPHIYVAFYNHLDPVVYQQASLSWQAYHDQNLRFLDQYDGYSLGKYTFGTLKFIQKPALYVGLPGDFPASVPPMFSVDRPDGTPAVYVSRL